MGRNAWGKVQEARRILVEQWKRPADQSTARQVTAVPPKYQGQVVQVPHRTPITSLTIIRSTIHALRITPYTDFSSLQGHTVAYAEMMIDLSGRVGSV